MSLFRWHYAHEKLSFALGSMASSSEPFSKRLANAYVAYLAILQERDFPRELWARFSQVREAMTVHPARWEGEGGAHASMAALHPIKVRKLIETLSSIEFSLVHIYDERSAGAK